MRLFNYADNIPTLRAKLKRTTGERAEELRSEIRFWENHEVYYHEPETIRIKRKMRQLSKEEIATVTNLSSLGKTVSEIGKTIHIRRDVLISEMKKYGIPTGQRVNSDSLRKKIATLAKGGLHYDQIAKETGKSVSRIEGIARECGIKVKKRIGYHPPWETQKHSEWESMLAKGISAYKIAALYSVTPTAVYLAMRRMKERKAKSWQHRNSD